MRHLVSLFVLLIVTSTFSNNPNNLNISDFQSSGIWQLVTTDHKPQARYIHGMVYDSSRHVMVLFGGDSSGTSRLNDTWEYDGVDWSLINTPTRPSGRANLSNGMVFDSNRNRTVLFGGLTATGYVNDTWEFDGSTWTQINTSTSPSARDAYAAAFDTKRNVVVLFGGHRSGVAAMSDTWEYNGVTWQQRTLSTIPPGRWYAPMAYDEKRGVMVLFGGIATTSSKLNDTWEYDGTDWRQVVTPQYPSQRSNNAMAFNSHLGETILYGGIGGNNTLLGDTWRYNGVIWEQVNTNQPPPAKGDTQMAYNTQQQKFVFFGGGYWFQGQPKPTIYGDTWELQLGTAPVNLSITHIEVIQSIIYDNDFVNLISQKPTLVRVYVDCGEGCTSLSGVSGILDYNSALINGSIPPENGSITAHHVNNWTDDQADLDRTLYFKLPVKNLDGIVNLTAHVTANGQSASYPATFTFYPGQKLRIAWTEFGYQSGNIIYTPNQNIMARGPEFLKDAYPVGYYDVEYFYQYGFNFVTREKFYCDTHDPLNCPEISTYFHYLNLFWDRITQYGLWVASTPPARMVGWFPQNALVSTCGLADSLWVSKDNRFLGGGKGRVAVVMGATCAGQNTPTISPYQVFAHELAHTLNANGIKHTPVDLHIPNNPCSSATSYVDNSYPYYPNLPRGSIGTYGFDWNKSRLIDPQYTTDFMTYCNLTWMSPLNYKKLSSGFAQVIPQNQASTSTNSTTFNLLVSGTIYTPTLDVSLDPFYTITSTVPADPLIAGDYCLELQAQDETILDQRCFNLAFASLENGNMSFDIFSLVMPYPIGVSDIVLTHLGVPIKKLTVSKNSPKITFTYPTGGESWLPTGIYTSTWTAGDADGDPLQYALDYSTDQGVYWTPIGFDISEPQKALDASRLPGGSSIRLRVSATDGVNTTYAISPSFSVGRKGPKAFILSPEDNEMILPSTTLLFNGYAYDLEDGTLGDSSLQWSSNIDGNLGIGSIVQSHLSLGQHIITLTATDSDGNTTTVTINVYVGSKVYLPITNR